MSAILSRMRGQVGTPPLPVSHALRWDPLRCVGGAGNPFAVDSRIEIYVDQNHASFGVEMASVFKRVALDQELLVDASTLSGAVVASGASFPGSSRVIHSHVAEPVDPPPRHCASDAATAHGVANPRVTTAAVRLPAQARVAVDCRRYLKPWA
jgi:hypothetical protein